MPLIKKLIALSALLLLVPATSQAAEKTDLDQELLKNARSLLIHVRNQAQTDSLEQWFNEIRWTRLKNGLPSDHAKKAFWLNIYNAYYQVMAERFGTEDPQRFTIKRVPIAGRRLSFDDIEQVILRRDTTRKSVTDSLIALAVAEVDYRIHFALNCGAESCPPIAVYRYDDIDALLDLASKSYLSTETNIDSSEKTVQVSQLLYWYKDDFGGEKGILRMLSQYLNRDFSGYKIAFRQFNWQTELGNWRSLR